MDLRSLSPPHFPVFQGIYCWIEHEKPGGFCLRAVTNPSLINSMKTKSWRNELEFASTLSLRWEVPEEMDHRKFRYLEFLSWKGFPNPGTDAWAVVESPSCRNLKSMWGGVALEVLGMVGLDFGGFSSLNNSRILCCSCLLGQESVTGATGPVAPS